MSFSYRTKLWFLRMNSLLMMMNLSGYLTNQVKKWEDMYNLNYIKCLFYIMQPNIFNLAIASNSQQVSQENYNLFQCICPCVETWMWKEKMCRQNAWTFIYSLKSLLKQYYYAWISVFLNLLLLLGDITIFKQSSMFIQMHTEFGLELVVQTSPVFQAYVKVSAQFQGRTLGKKSSPHEKETIQRV